MSLNEQITFLQGQLSKPDVSVIEQFEIVEHFYKYSELELNENNMDYFIRDTQKLTDKQRRKNDGKR